MINSKGPARVEQPGRPSRPQAVRHLLDLALEAEERKAKKEMIILETPYGFEVRTSKQGRRLTKFRTYTECERYIWQEKANRFQEQIGRRGPPPLILCHRNTSA